jgi:signal transduction histidine kinase/ActR/RegA family two-component response regulator
MGKNPRFLQSGETPEIVYKGMWEAIKNGSTWYGEFVNRKKNGDIYYESASISPILDENNTITHFVAVKEDITEKKNLVRDLIISKEKAEESDRLKTAFLANMSHEIRTPMNAIMGFSELLASKKLNEDTIHKYANVINSRSVYLLSLIDDILDLSKAEAGITRLRETCCQLNELLDEINAQTKLKLEKFRKPVIFILEKEKKTGNSTICTDKTRLQQILINLIDNAIKFTIEGKITLTYTTDRKKGIVFCISDTGIGIPHNDLDKVFERFHKSNNLSLNYSGLGLGLSICNGIVKMMGGEIWVKSEEGKGSSFYFNIPLKFPPDGKPNRNRPAAEYEDNVGGTILLVEDDESNTELMKEVLAEFNLLIADNGEKALELYNSHKNIDLILMEIKLPDMDGLEITRTIRRSGAQIPIVAFTAYAFETDRQNCFEAGCTGFVSKPLETKLLVQEIKNYMKDHKLSVVRN